MTLYQKQNKNVNKVLKTALKLNFLHSPKTITTTTTTTTTTTWFYSTYRAVPTNILYNLSHHLIIAELSPFSYVYDAILFGG